MLPRYSSFRIVLSVLLILILQNLFVSSAFAQGTSQQLKGRIEKIFMDGDVTLPVELQATAAKFDLRLLEQKKQPRILDGRLKSFPVKLRGDWKGPFHIVSVTYNPDFSAKVSPAYRQFSQPGREGEAAFRFYTPRAGVVTMAPPMVRFPYGFSGGGKSRYVYLSLYDPSTGKLARPPSGGVWTTLGGGASVDSTLLLNKVRMLGAEKVEQDLVVSSVHTAFSDHSKRQVYSEHVYEFERVGLFHLKVRLGTVDYDKDKRWLVKVLYEGDVH
ncbi:MAG: hypothetical protein R3C24_18165 [Cyanobacteriota/Melainabacteria group bacterium]